MDILKKDITFENFKGDQVLPIQLTNAELVTWVGVLGAHFERLKETPHEPAFVSVKKHLLLIEEEYAKRN